MFWLIKSDVISSEEDIFGLETKTSSYSIVRSKQRRQPNPCKYYARCCLLWVQIFSDLQTAAPAGLTSHCVFIPHGVGLHCPAALPTRAATPTTHNNIIRVKKLDLKARNIAVVPSAATTQLVWYNCVCIECSRHVPWMFNACTLNIHGMYHLPPGGPMVDIGTEPLNVHCLFLKCSSNVTWMFIACALNINWMYLECSLHVP